MKKLLYLIGTFLILLLVFTACSPKQPTEVPIEEITTEESPTEVVEEEASPVEETPTSEVVEEEEVLVTEVVEEMQFSEAPMLTEKVSAGTLPSIEERLPNDIVITPPWNDGVGKYGGIIRVGALSPTTYLDAWWVTSYEGLLRLAPNLSDITPNVVKEWEVSDDATSITMKLVEGIKWSDGDPFDANDIMFWWNDVILNSELTGAIPSIWMSGGESMEVVMLDAYTVQFTFSAPYPNIERVLAHENGANPVIYPEHYLKEFHAAYADEEELAKKVADQGLESWVQLFSTVTGHSMYRPFWVGLPTLQPFILASTSADNIVFERNPYYWKVDIEGNQLPYADGVNLEILASGEMYTAKAVAGSFDFAAHRTELSNYPLYQENAASANYRVELWPTLQTYYMQPNLTVEDEKLNELFNDVEFRRVLSVALDRDELNEVLSFGLAKPEQITVHVGSSFYKEEFAQTDAAFDPGLANQILDDLGLDQKDQDGFRLYPDGTKVTWSILVNEVGEYMPMVELMVDMYREVGLDVRIDGVSPDLGMERINANQAAMCVWRASGLSDQMFLSWPSWYLPIAPLSWAKCSGGPWSAWVNSQGATGVEPPQAYLDLLDVYNELAQTLDPARRVELGLQLVAAQSEGIFNIGFLAYPPRPIIISDRLKNTIPADVATVGFDTGVYYAFHSEVMWLDD